MSCPWAVKGGREPRCFKGLKDWDLKAQVSIQDSHGSSDSWMMVFAVVAGDRIVPLGSGKTYPSVRPFSV